MVIKISVGMELKRAALFPERELVDDGGGEGGVSVLFLDVAPGNGKEGGVEELFLGRVSVEMIKSVPEDA